MSTHPAIKLIQHDLDQAAACIIKNSHSNIADFGRFHRKFHAFFHQVIVLIEDIGHAKHGCRDGQISSFDKKEKPVDTNVNISCFISKVIGSKYYLDSHSSVSYNTHVEVVI